MKGFGTGEEAKLLHTFQQGVLLANWQFLLKKNVYEWWGGAREDDAGPQASYTNIDRKNPIWEPHLMYENH